MVFLRLEFGQKHLRRAAFVDHVDRFVRQLAVVDIAHGQLHGGLDGLAGVADFVEVLEIGLQPLDDLYRVGDRRFVHVDFLEAPHQRAVLLEILAIFLVSRRADAPQRALRQRGLQQIGGVHRAARGRAGSDHRVDFVDEQDRVLVLLDFLDDLFQALLEIAAIPRAGEQRAHIEREDGRARENFRHFAKNDLSRQPLGDGGLANAGIADQQRVVFLAPAQHLDCAENFGLSPDQGIDSLVARFLVEVDAICVERALLFARVAIATLARLVAVDVFLGAARPARRVGKSKPLGDAVADVIHRVIARHVLLLQEIDGVTLAFGEQRHQHIGSAHILAAGRLNADDGALDNTLKARRRFALFRVFVDQIV